MNITVIGGGRVGLPTAAGLASIGHEVVCCERDKAKRDAATSGKAPFFDAGLDDLLATTVRDGKLRFDANVETAVADAEAVIAAVPVPSGGDGLDGLQAVAKAVADVAPNCVFIVKSTVPPGTCARLQQRFGMCTASNPEFLRQEHGVEDFLSPARIVVGGNDARARKILRNIYQPLIARGIPYIETDCASAEISKLTANLFLAVRITLLNETADLCESANGDIADVIRVIAADNRIGTKYLNPGIGFGGGCLPKDGRLLTETAAQLNTPMPAVEAVYASNHCRLQNFADRVANILPPPAIIAVWGLAFKPNADSVCESPPVSVALGLCERGYRIHAHDENVSETDLQQALPKAKIFDNPIAALTDADMLMVLNPSAAHAQSSLARISQTMKGRVIFDCANIFDQQEAKKLGMTIYTIGAR